MRKLTVLYDATCAFCIRCRSGEAERRFPGVSSPEDELVVVSDEGAVYRGDGAFLMCLWALEDYREWSLRLAAPAMRPLARRAMEWVSHNRAGFSRWLARQDDRQVAGILNSGPPAGAC